jgi:hypothetical protein
MHDWNVLITDATPYTMALIFISMLLYSYKPTPCRILCGYYLCFSFLFLSGLHLDVNAWVSFPIAVALGMAIGEVVKQEVNPAYFYPHITVVLFGLAPLGPTWILFPLIFSAMCAISGYKRMFAYSVPTLILTSVLSTQIGAAPLVALCCSACMLLPFALLCELFPKDIPFEPV